MNYLMIVLRLIHIFSGVFWVGAALMLYFFIGPTVGATAEAGQRVMQHIITRTRFTAAIASAGGLTVLAGAILYWLDSKGFTSAWMKTGAGIGLTLGSIFGLVGFISGIMVGRYTTTIGKVGSQIQGQPTAEQITQITTAQKQLAVVSPIQSISLILAVLLMASARYFMF